jgi:hypothetical protein
MPLAMSSLASSRALRAAASDLTGYAPKDSFFCLPVTGERQAISHSLDPFHLQIEAVGVSQLGFFQIAAHLSGLGVLALGIGQRRLRLFNAPPV